MNSKLIIALLAGMTCASYNIANAAIVSPTTSGQPTVNMAPQQPQSGTNSVNGTASGMMNAPAAGSTTQTINQQGVTTRTDLTTGRVGAPSATNPPPNNVTATPPSTLPNVNHPSARAIGTPAGQPAPAALPQNVSQQGTNAYDAAVTRQIRERITRSDLSMNARNVKIITLNGQVVLRGPVDSSAEQTTIQNIARDIVGSGRVRDETTIK